MESIALLPLPISQESENQRKAQSFISLQQPGRLYPSYQSTTVNAGAKSTENGDSDIIEETAPLNGGTLQEAILDAIVSNPERQNRRHRMAIRARRASGGMPWLSQSEPETAKQSALDHRFKSARSPPQLWRWRLNRHHEPSFGAMPSRWFSRNGAVAAAATTDSRATWLNPAVMRRLVIIMVMTVTILVALLPWMGQDDSFASRASQSSSSSPQNNGFWPTHHELALVEHYYGRSSSSSYSDSSNDANDQTLPAAWRRLWHMAHPLDALQMSWRMRQAQFTADTARITHLSSAATGTIDDDSDSDSGSTRDAGSSTRDGDDSGNTMSLQAPTLDENANGSLRHRTLKHGTKKENRKHGRHETRKSNTHHRPKKPKIRDGCETTIVLMRHCEKGSVVEHCAYQGYERSVYVASLFGDTATSRWPTPSYIFAEGPQNRHGHKMNFREVETVGPLAQRINVKVDDSYTDESRNDLASRVLQVARDGALCGKVVLFVWKHSSIAHLARNLACGPTEGCPLDYSGKTFDQIWQIKLVYRTWEHSTAKKKFVQDDDDTATTASAVSTPTWKVFGSIQNEGFDPLAVSKQFGDYPPGGTVVGGRWEAQRVSYPERRHKKDRDGWHETRVEMEPHRGH